MVEYKDFQLTAEQLNKLSEKNARYKIRKYIKEHGTEPTDVEDFYEVTDDDIEVYKQSLYSKYYTVIRRLKDTIKKDYDELYAESENLVYWESHITLNKKLEDTENIFDLYPISVESIFEILNEGNPDDTVAIIRTTNLLTGKMTEVRIPGAKMYEDHVIFPEEIKLEINDGLKCYWESNIERTTGNKVSIRRPINPKYKHPCYIIGQQDSPLFVFVDAVTGEILSE